MQERKCRHQQLIKWIHGETTSFASRGIFEALEGQVVVGWVFLMVVMVFVVAVIAVRLVGWGGYSPLEDRSL
jgi:hypothetical protein